MTDINSSGKQVEFSLDHGAVSVSSLATSVDFYTNIFGFTCERYIDMPDNRGKIALLRKAGFTIEMFEFTGAQTPDDEDRKELGDLRILGDRHFAFRVKDIWETAAYLREHGVHFDSEPMVGSRGFYRFFITDPDGIPIELTEGPE